MKEKLICSLVFIFCFLFLSEKLYSQSEFPVGAYLMGRPDMPLTPPLYKNYYSVKEAGINTVFQYCIPLNDPDYNSNKDSLSQFESLIPINSFGENDYVYYYSAGMYSKWEAENNQTDENKIGIKHSFGKDTTYSGVRCWFSGTDQSKVNKSLVYGPNYLQYKKYPTIYSGDPINYVLKVRMIKATESSGNQDVCKITVLDDQDSSLVVKYVNEEDLETEWNQNSIIETNYFHNTKTAKYSPTDPYYKLMDSDQSKSDKIGLVQYQIEWLASIPVFVDFIEVYDSDVWQEYLLFPSEIEDTITNYVNKFSGWNNIKYWNSLDEPHSVDSHVPYKSIDTILSDNNKPNLLTAFYPEWNGLRDGVNSIPLFANGIENIVTGANPQKLMIYYYPYWPNTENFDDIIDDFSGILQDAWEVDENYWYLAQAMESRTGVHDSTMLRRRPTRSEFRAPVMMALQYGAKGIMFWPYYSYWDKDSTDTWYKRAWAIEHNKTHEDTTFDRTNLWYELKDIATRLSGNLGAKLINAEYTGDSAKTKNERRIIGGYLEIDPVNTNWFSTNLLEDSYDSHLKYFMVVNCNSDSTTGLGQTYKFKVDSLTGYYNWYWKDVEDTNDTRHVFKRKMNYDYTDTLNAGDGRLYEVAPVLKYGGGLVFNDTLNANQTLSGQMTIKANSTLTLNKVYTITEDIYVEDGGMIETNLNGGITLSSGAELEFEDWSDGLVISQYSDHPKLYWSEHPTQEELAKYEIYRKKDSQSFQLIHTITDKTVTEYEDTAVEIMYLPGSNEASVYYYVRTVVMPSRSWIEIDRTITVELEQVQGNPQEKSFAEGAIITEYGLEQNHPNPFNP